MAIAPAVEAAIGGGRVDRAIEPRGGRHDEGVDAASQEQRTSRGGACRGRSSAVSRRPQNTTGAGLGRETRERTA